MSVRILEIVGNIFTHMPSKPSVRPGSREALVQGLGPRDLYLISHPYLFSSLLSKVWLVSPGQCCGTANNR